MDQVRLLQDRARTDAVAIDARNNAGTTYQWDLLNRMTSLNANRYLYRGAGMRVQKTVGTTTAVYRYAGQMGFEDVDTNGSSVTVNDYALGPRGSGAISRTTSSGTTVSYPLYDAHGNMISTLSKGSQAGTFTFTAERMFDAWGLVRSSNAAGDPKGRYCASLGHKQDDESGLIYMRARYYEPQSGRFLSEDPSRQGNNCFVYGCSCATSGSDYSGKMFTIFELGYTIAEIMGIRAKEAAMLALALERCGNRIASIVEQYDLKLDMITQFELEGVD